MQRDGGEWASAYLEHGDVMLLVDPVLPAAGADLDRFTRAIDRDLARLGGPVWVMLTRADQRRDAEAVLAITGARVWVPGEPPPPGAEEMPTGRAGEAAVWSPTHRALMPGVALRVDAGRLVGEPGVDVAGLLAVSPDVVVPSVGPMVA